MDIESKLNALRLEVAEAINILAMCGDKTPVNQLGEKLCKALNASAAPVPAMPIPKQESAGAVYDDGLTDSTDYVQSIINKSNRASPRITEQDARKIIYNFSDNCSQGDFRYWYESKGRALLNKLNANAVVAQAEAIPEKMTRAEAIEKSKEYPAPKHEDRDYDKLFARCCHLERLLLGL